MGPKTLSPAPEAFILEADDQRFVITINPKKRLCKERGELS